MHLNRFAVRGCYSFRLPPRPCHNHPRLSILLYEAQIPLLVGLQNFEYCFLGASDFSEKTSKTPKILYKLVFAFLSQIEKQESGYVDFGAFVGVILHDFACQMRCRYGIFKNTLRDFLKHAARFSKTCCVFLGILERS